jgi:hypothetical protein
MPKSSLCSGTSILRSVFLFQFHIFLFIKIFLLHCGRRCSESYNEAVVSVQPTVHHQFAQLFTSPQYIILQQGFFVCSVRFQQAFVLKRRMDGQTTRQLSQSFFIELISYETKLFIKKNGNLCLQHHNTIILQCSSLLKLHTTK